MRCLLKVSLAFNRQSIQSTGSQGWQRNFGRRSEALPPQSSLTLGDCRPKPGCNMASVKPHQSPADPGGGSASKWIEPGLLR